MPQKAAHEKTDVLGDKHIRYKVPRTGVEPARGFPHNDLNVARLPIPPPGQVIPTKPTAATMHGGTGLGRSTVSRNSKNTPSPKCRKRRCDYNALAQQSPEPAFRLFSIRRGLLNIFEDRARVFQEAI